MDRNGEEQAASTAFSNTTSSVFYCSTHGPGVAFDLHDTTSPWIFAAFATITAPIAFLLNTLTILAVKKKMELRQKLSYILLSSMAVADLLIGGIGVPLSAYSCLVTSLSNSGCPAFLFDGLGTFNADVRFIVLLAYPSDNDCVGAVHSHSKME